MGYTEGLRLNWEITGPGGCVGLSNSAIEDFYDKVAIGTPVIIQK